MPYSFKVQTMLFDRLSSLPDELLIGILSLLPTKDAAATSVLSRRFIRLIFPYITSLDFDPSPIHLCLVCPYAIHRYPTFVNFVDTVLLHYNSQYLTKFRLKVGSGLFDVVYADQGCCYPSFFGVNPGCLPDLNAERLHAWISFPLKFYHSLKELDLDILVRDSHQHQLPPAIFTCQTLEVLKLVVNLGLDKVITMPSSYILLPNLRLLSLTVSFISDDDFLPRLVSSCPSLEDLTFEAITNRARHTTISSTSLRRLSLIMNKASGVTFDNTDLVVIDTPNLEYLYYEDNLAVHYSIPLMGCLAKAELNIFYILLNEHACIQGSFQNILSLLRACSHAQHLSLIGYLVREFDYDGYEKILMDQMPLFPNLKHLGLGCGYENFFWDKLMLPFLNSSPILETLFFIEGLIVSYEETCMSYLVEKLEVEREYFRKNHAIPLCCRYHLKRIVINSYFGRQREVEIIHFFLRHALVLEELVVCRSQREYYPKDWNGPIPDRISVENTLNNLPKASLTCSIRVI